MPDSIPCPYCKGATKLITGAQLMPDVTHLAETNFHRCEPCDAHARCHPDTTDPLGTMADEELRVLRIRLHKVFDPMWRGAMKWYEPAAVARAQQRMHIARLAQKRILAWLAEGLEIPQDGCHIPMLDKDQCLQARRALDNAEYPAIREWAKEKKI